MRRAGAADAAPVFIGLVSYVEDLDAIRIVAALDEKFDAVFSSGESN